MAVGTRCYADQENRAIRENRTPDNRVTRKVGYRFKFGQAWRDVLHQSLAFGRRA